MNNITIGQYINRDSWLHRLDPRMKLLGLIFLLVAIFMLPIPSWQAATKQKEIQTIIILGIFFIGSLVLTVSAKIPLGKAMSGIRGIMFLLMFTFVVQIISKQEGVILLDQTLNISLFSIGLMIAVMYVYYKTKRYIPFKTIYFLLLIIVLFLVQAVPPYVNFIEYNLVIREQALVVSGFLFFRIATVIIFTSLLTYTTITTDLNYGIEALLKPLKLIGVPIEIFSMMLSLTLRSIPTLLGETNKIMKAQASRGADFKENKLKDKIIQIVALLIPVFSISFKRAADMSNAMEVRGYVIGAKRSRIDEYRLGFIDMLSLIISILILAAIIYIRYFYAV